MRVDEFDFDLPPELIAERPAEPRDAARLLVWDGVIRDGFRVRDLPGLLRAGDLLVLNDTKVIPARLYGRRERGPNEVAVEMLLLKPMGEGRWQAMARPLKRLKPGDRVICEGGIEAELIGRDVTGENAVFAFGLSDGDLLSRLEAAGAMPLPPYIVAKRRADARDRADYQTVFARERGSVAAPTAGLHFTPELLQRLEAAGIGNTRVTLHVGAGTFLPVKADTVAEHKMHSEWGRVDEAAASAIRETKARGGRVIPVGTTAMRLIESAAASGEISPYMGETDIFITPGYRFRVADALLTNFHLPRSTLVMLVAALIGHEAQRALYAHAIAARYRFYSYGDASLLFRKDA